MADLRTATATEKPCQLYAHTAPPIPLRTQGHHRHPVYLQNRVYGRIVLPELFWVCGLCHDAVHEILGWMLGESRQPDPLPSTRSSYYREAARTYDWYIGARSARKETQP